MRSPGPKFPRLPRLLVIDTETGLVKRYAGRIHINTAQINDWGAPDLKQHLEIFRKRGPIAEPAPSNPPTGGKAA